MSILGIAIIGTVGAVAIVGVIVAWLAHELRGEQVAPSDHTGDGWKN